MAYVRKTDLMIADVEQNLHAMRAKAIAPYQGKRTVNMYSPIYKSLYAAVETAIWSDAPDLRGKLPAKWLAKYDAIHVKYEYDGDTNGSKYMQIETTPEDKFKVPKTDGRSYHPDVTLKREHMDETLYAWLKEEKSRDAKYQEIDSKFEVVRDQVLRFLRNHASLNAAITAMPEIELYIPERYLAKMRAPSAPRGKKASTPTTVENMQIDVNTLTSVAIAHRVTK